MATYTPNYNLSKPEATDDFDAFRASYGDNMDKIDQNMGGGGGGGGHTIVDPTGADMPQENKLQFTGAVNVSDDSVNGQTVVGVIREVIELTQAEYDALPASKLSDGIAYFIKDSGGSDTKADKSDLASIQITGTVNDTGSTITSGTYFYLNGTLVRAKADISNGATFTLNTNYEVITAGALNEIVNPIVIDSMTINDSSLGSIELYRYSNGMKQIYIRSTNLATSSYVSGYIIPARFRPRTPVINIGTAWGSNVLRYISIISDGRIQVGASTQAGLYAGTIYI